MTQSELRGDTMSNYNLHNSLYIKVNGKQFEYKPYYVPLFGDKFIRQKWHRRIYTPEDFKDAKGIAINIGKTTDFVCIDIDAKNLDAKSKDLIDVYIYHDLLKRPHLPVYIEQTQSGGYHIIARVSKQYREYILKRYVDGKYVANHCEIFMPELGNRLVVIAPSIITTTNEIRHYRTLRGDIEKLPLADKTIIEIIETIRDLVGKPEKETKQKTSAPKLKIRSNKLIFNFPYDIARILFKINDEIFTKPDILRLVLDTLGIDYEERETCFVLPAFTNPDYPAVIFKDTAVYYEFADRYATKAAYILYQTFPDKMYAFIQAYGRQFEPRLRFVPIYTVTELKEEHLKGRSLITALPGSGKTSFIQNLAMNRKHIILLEPLAVQVEQMEQWYLNLKEPTFKAAFLCEKTRLKNINNNIHLIVATYDQLSKIIEKVDISKYYLVIDEAHELIMAINYRNHAINYIWDVLEQRDQYTFMTATNYFIRLEQFVDVIYELQKPYISENRYFTIIECKNPINMICSNVLLVYKNYPKVKQFVYVDNRRLLHCMYRTLINEGVKPEDIVIVTSNDKSGVESIVTEYKLKHKIYLTTKVLSAGFHIFEEGTFVYHILPTDPNTLIQEIHRIRETKDGKPLNNHVYVGIYVRKMKNKCENYDKLWLTLYNRFSSIVETALKLLKQYENTDNNDNHLCYLGRDIYLRYAMKKRAYLHKYVFNEVAVRVANDASYWMKLLTDLDWKHINDTDYFATNEYVLVQMEAKSNRYYDIFDKLYNGEGFTLNANDIELLESTRIIYRLVMLLKMFKHVFTETIIKRIRDKIGKGNFKGAKHSITLAIKKWALENLDKIPPEDRAILEAKYFEVFRKLKDIVRKYREKIPKDIVLSIKQKFSIPNPEWSSILKGLGLRYNKNLGSYVRTNECSDSIIGDSELSKFDYIQYKYYRKKTLISIETETETETVIEITDSKVQINKLRMKIKELSRKAKKVIVRILNPLWLLDFKKRFKNRWNLITSIGNVVIELPDIGNTCYQIQEQLNVNFDIAYELYNIYEELRVKLCGWREWFEY